MSRALHLPGARGAVMRALPMRPARRCSSSAVVSTTSRGSRVPTNEAYGLVGIVAFDDTMSGTVTGEQTTTSEADTARIGRQLAATLRAGDVVLLYGDLGAGKTAFTKGLAEGLGLSGDEVSSPTFTIMQEYRGGRLSLFHVDLYR